MSTHDQDNTQLPYTRPQIADLGGDPDEQELPPDPVPHSEYDAVREFTLSDMENQGVPTEYDVDEPTPVIEDRPDSFYTDPATHGPDWGIDSDGEIDPLYYSRDGRG
jgi:hypothetical protein